MGLFSWLFKRKKKKIEEDEEKTEEEQKQDPVNLGSIEYKNWVISPIVDLVPVIDNGTDSLHYVRCNIRSKEYGIAYNIKSVVPSHETITYIKYISFWTSKTDEVERYRMWHRDAALSDIIASAKAMVDIFDEMKHFYSEKADEQIIRSVKDTTRMLYDQMFINQMLDEENNKPKKRKPRKQKPKKGDE